MGDNLASAPAPAMVKSRAHRDGTIHGQLQPRIYLRKEGKRYQYYHLSGETIPFRVASMAALRKVLARVRKVIEDENGPGSAY